jgi:Lrp/AsnC family leucine-responsive transcriptional regulator
MNELTVTSLDALDRRLLNQLQDDCSLTNLELAERMQTSAPTCYRRVRRLIDCGLIERQVAIVAPALLGRALGHGLAALVEVSLDRQSAEALDAFELQVAGEAAVQQCYRVSSGPDFVLVVHVPDMPAYNAFAHRVLSAAANVRNVRSLFSIHRSKFEPRIVV